MLKGLPEIDALVQQLAKALTSQKFRSLESHAETLVTPSLVGIYNDESTNKIEQIGTGFLLAGESNRILVTARHVLYGHGYDEDAREKRIMTTENGLRKIGHLRSEPVIDEQNDLVIMYCNEISRPGVLSASAISAVDDECQLITIHGFLARDFNIDAPNESLLPTPWTFSNKWLSKAPGYVAFKYASRWRLTSGLVGRAPVPRGMSGCPMLDGSKLMDGDIRIIGVFTTFVDYKGYALGESASKLASLMNKLE